MARCINCGQVISFHNIDAMAMMTDICKDCSKKLGTLDTFVVLNNHKNEQSAIQRQERNEEMKRRRKEDDERFWRKEEERAYLKQLQEDEEEYEREHILELEQDKLSYLNKQKVLIDKAEDHGIDPHAFNTNGYCFFCKRHVEDLFKEDQFICE